MNPISIGRRSFVRGVSTAAAALGLPTAAVALPAPAEHPNDKVRRLAREIMGALNDPRFLGFRQVTITPEMAMYQSAEQDMPADERVHLHFGRLASAMNDLTPDAHGWKLQAGEYNGGSGQPQIGEGKRWLESYSIRFERELDRRLAGGSMLVERFADRDLLHIAGTSNRAAPPIPTVRRA